MTGRIILVFTTCFMMSGCWFTNHSIPMPVNDAEFSKPVQKTFAFSPPRKFKWNVVSQDSVHPGHIYPFDITKLPAQPFNPGGMNALLKPPVRTAFQYAGLPDTVLNLENIPLETLAYKTSLLGTIKKVTLGQPLLRTESNFPSFQFNEDLGLPGLNIESIMNTREGLSWIYTTKGLAILHGESLEILPMSYGDCFFMAEDSLGQVWLRTISNGVIVINRKQGIQKQILQFQPGAQVRIDKKGFIWVCSFTDGIYLISPDQKTFRHVTKKNGLSSDSLNISFEDKEGRIWVGTVNKGIDILDPGLKKIKRMNPGHGLIDQEVLSFVENGEGDVFVGGNRKGVEIFNIHKETHLHLDSAQGIRKSQIFNIQEDELGRMWLGADTTGIYILSRNSDSISFIGIRDGINAGFVQSISKDANQQIYVGSLTGGLNVFPSTDQISHHLSTKDGILDADTWGFLEDSKQRLWIGGYSGVNIITPDQKITKLQILPLENRNNRAENIIQTGPEQFALCGVGSGLSLIDESNHTLEKIGIHEGLPSVRLRCLLKDSQGLIWMGTSDAGLIVFDPKQRTIRYINETSALGLNIITSVIEASPGKFLVSTYKAGLKYLDLAENTISTYSTNEGLSSELSISIYRDHENRFWVATEKGLNLLDPVRKTNTIFTVSNGMPANGIYSLIEKEGRMYVGTGKGLTIIKETKSPNPLSKESSWNLQTYGKSLGFPYLDFNGKAVVYTHTGTFWWGITPGITVINQSVFAHDTLSEPIDITGIDILGKAQYFIDPGLIKNTDTLWSENKDTFYLSGSFEKLNTDKQKGIDWKSLSSINIPVGLSLPHDRNYLRFHFGNFLPQDEGIYKYQYVLEGVDEKWSPITEQPVTDNYNNLSPGYYTFRVSARKGPGPWSEPSEFHFRIRPPWWFSWWAETLYFLIIVGVLRLWVSYRSRRLMKENSILEHKVTERTTELSNSLENLRQAQGQLIQAEKMASLGELTAGIAHEIQNPLNFVNNFSEVNTELLEDVNKALGQNDVQEAKELLKDVEMNMSKITFHGKRADAIVKGMLLHSRASSGQKIPTDVNALADEYLRLSYHGLRAKDKSFNAQFTMDFDEKTGQVMLVQQDIGRVLLNLFNNAFYSVAEKKKQSPEDYQPTVSVATKKKKDSIEIRIRDNGQGIPKKVIDKIYQPFFTTKPAGRGTGLGLSLSYDIITKEHGGKIDVVTKENEFTEFIIELPAHAVA
jgi:signal transduction histidine kinase/ligand-binding sensor domain-containing protein